jgi:hypothetical protein
MHNPKAELLSDFAKKVTSLLLPKYQPLFKGLAQPA